MHNKLFILKKYPKDELYRLVVDGQFHKSESGWLGYEKRQPGCLKAAFNGLAIAISDLDITEVSIELVQKLHKACTTNVKNLEKGTSPGHIRTENDVVGFYMPPHTMTEAGLVDILDLIDSQTQYGKYLGSWVGPALNDEAVADTNHKKIDVSRAINHSNINSKREIFFAETNAEVAKILFPATREGEEDFNHYIAPRSGSLEHELKLALEKYNTNIKLAKTDDQKLLAITTLIWECDHIHPFADANIRTFAILLLNRLLLQNGFPPATFTDPNVFDGHSKQELVGVVKQAIENTNQLIAGATQLFGFSSIWIDPFEQVRFQNEYAKKFITAIDTEYAKQKLLSLKQYIKATWGKTENHHGLYKSTKLLENTPEAIKADWKTIKEAYKNNNFDAALAVIVARNQDPATTNTDQRYLAIVFDDQPNISATKKRQHKK